MPGEHNILRLVSRRETNQAAEFWSSPARIGYDWRARGRRPRRDIPAPGERL
ncbi:MAG: hypothetical protein HY774_05335 [Acidobacteria bacterium]|nr:hypothetical protein [Acidobacteriota bacterium]